MSNLLILIALEIEYQIEQKKPRSERTARSWRYRSRERWVRLVRPVS